MVLTLRSLIVNYRIPLAIYAAALAWVTWFCGIANDQSVPFSSRFAHLYPFCIVIGMMAIQFGWGNRFWLWNGTPHEASERMSISVAPWNLACLLLCILTWLSFLFIIAWHDFPQHSAAHLIRTLLALLSCSILAFFWGSLATRIGENWFWLAPFCTVIGWATGVGLGSESVRFDNHLLDDLQQLPSEVASQLSNIAFLPLLLIGVISSLGIWMERRAKANLIFCLSLIPLMVGLGYFNTWLQNHHRESTSQKLWRRSGVNDLPPHLQGTIQLSPIDNDSPQRLETPWSGSDRNSWTFEIPWLPKILGEDIHLISGDMIDAKLTHAGKEVPRIEWEFKFDYESTQDSHMIFQVRHTPRSKKSSRKSQELPSAQPNTLQITGNMVLRAHRLVRKFPANEQCTFNIAQIRFNSSHPKWRDFSGSRESGRARFTTIPLFTQSWNPIPAISGERDPLLGQQYLPLEAFALTWNYRGRSSWPRHASHCAPELRFGSPLSCFHWTTLHDPSWMFPPTENEAAWATFLQGSTMSLYHRHAVLEQQVTIDIALP